MGKMSPKKPRQILFKQKISGTGIKSIFKDITKKFKDVFTSRRARRIISATKGGIKVIGKKLLPLLGKTFETLIDKGLPFATEALLKKVGSKGTQQQQALLRTLLTSGTKALGKFGKEQLKQQIKQIEGKPTTPGKLAPLMIQPSPSIPTKTTKPLTATQKRQVRAILGRRRVKLGRGLLTM